MRHLRLVAVHGQPVAAGGHGALCAEDELDFSAAIWDLLRSYGCDNENDSREKDRMETSGSALERQLRQIQNMATQHFPQDEAARNAYMVELLTAKLREYAYKFDALPVRQMK